MGESVIKSLFSFFSTMCEYVIKATTTKPLKKDKRDITSCTKAIMILLDGNSLPAKKTISDSTANRSCSFSLFSLLEGKIFQIRF
ncbi:unnamed protein product [Arabidopsis halleri]